MPSGLLRELKRLETLREQGALGEALALARRLRPRWAELLNLARSGARPGAGSGRAASRIATRLLLRRLFRAGLFDEVPLSGEPYAAWRMGRSLAGPEYSALIPAPDAPLPPARDPFRSSARDPSCGPPFFSLIMPVYDPVPAYLEAALDSLRAQTFADWELCAADDASSNPRIREILLRRAAEDSRIRPLFRTENGHISAASNTALESARGTWCVLMDHDDVLPPEALARMAGAAEEDPRALVLFSDEDRLEEGGRRNEGDSLPEDETLACLTSPLFKHGFDPDLFLACNVVSHLGVYRTDMLRELGAFRPGMEGGQDYDLALRALAAHGASVFRHVPAPLYHWRKHAGSTSSGIEAKPYARDAALRARQSYAAAFEAGNAGMAALRFQGRPGSGFADVRFVLPGEPPLLSLILFDEGGLSPRMEARVLAAWKEKAALRAYGETEILAVRAKAASAEGHAAFVQACNALAGKALGAVLAFVRAGDDPSGDSWARMAAAALSRPDVGVAGCRALDAQAALQQAGYAVGWKPLSLGASLFGPACPGTDIGAPFWLCPAYAGLHAQSPGYYAQAHLLHSVPAVYLSGLFVHRTLFAGLGGLRPEAGELAAADFCLRAWFERGLRSIVVPGADLLTSAAVPPRPADEFFARVWGETLADGVPFQSPHLDWTPGGWRLRPL